MKVRIGFVSNSSSTSFSIYGVALDFSELEELVKAKLGTEFNEEEYDRYEAVESLTEGTNLETHSNYDWGTVWIGRDPAEVGDEETGAQFRKSVKDAIEKALGKRMPCSVHAESWYDG